MKQLTTEDEYDAALGRAWELNAILEDSPEGRELDALITAIEDYEAKFIFPPTVE